MTEMEKRGWLSHAKCSVLLIAVCLDRSICHPMNFMNAVYTLLFVARDASSCYR